MTLTLGEWLSVVQILSILAGGLWVAAGIRSSNERQSLDIADIKAELKKLADVITALAVQNERMNMMQRQIDELRHGKGYVTA